MLGRKVNCFKISSNTYILHCEKPANSLMYHCDFQEWSFSSIRVESPVVLVVNGRKVGQDQQASVQLSSFKYADWIQYRYLSHQNVLKIWIKFVMHQNIMDDADICLEFVVIWLLTDWLADCVVCIPWYYNLVSAYYNPSPFPPLILCVWKDFEQRTHGPFECTVLSVA
jgi:hypothetical protein